MILNNNHKTSKIQIIKKLILIKTYIQKQNLNLQIQIKSKNKKTNFIILTKITISKMKKKI